ncbi:MAG: aldehyde dehydrogenase family protein, partial [Pseudomonadota bacterium]
MSSTRTASDPNLSFETKSMLIDGAWTEAASGATFDVIDPATECVIAVAPLASAEDVSRAVKAARRAFSEPAWRQMPPLERQAMLLRIADGIEARAEEFARLESCDNGKPIGDARAIDVPFAIATFRYMAGWPARTGGDVLNLSTPGGPYHAYTLRQPVGVAGLIIPWNFPLIMAAMKVAPALAAGCAMVLKPAEQTPLTALLLGEVVMDAGVPAGIFNVITGDGAETGAALVAHPGVDKIAFTGSTPVGKEIGRACAAEVKRVSLELGGKSPMLVLDDADLDVTIPGAAQAIFWNSGQVCFAGSRLYADYKIYDKLVSGLSEIASSLKLGPGVNEETQLGPLVSEGQKAKVLSLIESGESEGAEIVAGGGEPGGPGYFVQ